MKKSILFSLLFSVALTSSAQTEGSQKPLKKLNSIELIEQTTKSSAKANPNFVPGYMDTYEFNGVEYDLETRNTYTYLFGNVVGIDEASYWDEINQEFFAFNRRVHNRTADYQSDLSEYYDGMSGDWVPSSTDTTFKDEFGYDTKIVSYYYDSFLDSWNLNWGEVIDIVYDNNDNPTEMTYYELNPDGSLTIDYKEVWIWDGGDSPIELVYQEWDEIQEVWTTEMRAINLAWFDFSSFKIMNAEVQFWDDEVEAWENEFKITASYFSNGITQQSINYSWEDDDWLPNYKRENTLDDKGTLAGSYNYAWVNEWILSGGEEFSNSYDTDNNLIEQIVSYYNDFEEVWFNGPKLVYGDYTPLSVTSLISNNQFVVYPNPVQDRITIESEIELTQVVILDALGNTVYVSAGEKQVDVSSFRNGVYFVQLIHDNGVTTRKVIKH